MSESEKYHVDRKADAEWIKFSPTDLFRIICGGGPGVPDMFEEYSARGDSPPMHRHEWPSWELVIEGSLRFVVGEESFHAGPGDAVYVAPNVPHTYVVESNTARVVGINLSEGRFPKLQREASSLLLAPEGPDMARLQKLAAAHGVDVLGPPLEPEGMV